MSQTTAAATALPSARSTSLPIDSIVASKTNPRKHFDKQYLADLAGSIREKGVIQPIIVRPRAHAGAYELVVGECRWQASKLAGQTEIPVIVRTLSDGDVLDLQLVENLHRKDLSPLEQAVGYRALITANPDKHSAETIATRIGMSPAWVWDRLKLNDLIPEAKALLDQERMTVGHAILLARLKPADQQRAIEPGRGRNGWNLDGLWQGESWRLDLDEDEERKDKYAGLKAVSIREFDRWIQQHVRFDPAHAAQAQPLVFEATAAKIETAAAQPGRGKKVIPITHEYRVADDARDDAERTYGGESWQRADGQAKSKTCEHSVLGVVVAGAGYGDTFPVCVARDKCPVHFGAVIRQKEKNAKLREGGKGTTAAKREAKAKVREREQREAEERTREAWNHVCGRLVPAVKAAASTVKVAGPLYAAVLKVHQLPAGTKPVDLPRVLLRAAVDDMFASDWFGQAPEQRAWAKLLGVDVKAIEAQVEGPTAAAPPQKAAKKR